MSYPPNYQTHQFPVATPEDSDVVRIERGPDSFQATVAGIKGGGGGGATGPTGPTGATGGGSLPLGLTGANTFTTVGATAGAYTLANSGIVVKNDGGDEVYRIWGTDPNIDNDWGSGNLYIGLDAGEAQTTNNTDSGYLNVGIGYDALSSNTTGFQNTAVGAYALAGNVNGQFNVAMGKSALFESVSGSNNTAVGGFNALQVNTTGSDNSAFGTQALSSNTTGSNNTGIGKFAGAPDASADFQSVVDTHMVFVGDSASRGGVSNATPLDNGIAIGYGATVLGSNKAVIGNASVTDVYFGSATGAAKLHGKGDAIVFPDSDPHVAGAAYWVAGVLTKSAG